MRRLYLLFISAWAFSGRLSSGCGKEMEPQPRIVPMDMVGQSLACWPEALC